MYKRLARSMLLAVGILAVAGSVFGTAFPGKTAGVNIGGELNSDGEGNTEPSGVIWQPRRELLYVVHDGGARVSGVFELDFEGDKKDDWNIGNGRDLEALAYQDSDDKFIWLGQERDTGGSSDVPKILKFHIEDDGGTSRGTLGAPIDLTDSSDSSDCGLRYDDTDDNQQMEGLTYVPTDGTGTFWAGKEQDGKIYEFTLSGTSIDCTSASEHDPASGSPPIGALDYSDIDDDVYVMYKDSHNITYELEPSGSTNESWDNPSRTYGVNEGLAVKKCHAFYAVDYAGSESAGFNQLWRHDFNLACLGQVPPFPCSTRHEEEKSLCGFGQTCQGSQMLRARTCFTDDALILTEHGSALAYGPTTDGYPSAYSFVVNNAGSAGTRWLTVLNGAYGSDRVSSARVKLNGTTLLDTTDITSSVGWVETTFTLPAGNSTLTIDNTTTILGSLTTLITDESVKP